MPDDGSHHGGSKNDGGGRKVKKEAMEMCELRVDVPRYIMDFIDATASGIATQNGKTITRAYVVRGVFNDRIKAEVHRIKIMQRALQDNGLLGGGLPRVPETMQMGPETVPTVGDGWE